jgi:hypothetical protein
VLLAVDLYENFIDVKGMTVDSIFLLQSPCVQSAKLDTPETDCCAADGKTSLGE